MGSLPEDEAKKLIRRVEAALQSGAKPPGEFGPGASAVEVVADDLISEGKIRHRRTVWHWLETAKTRHRLTPNWDLWVPARYHQHPPRAPGGIIKPVMPEALYSSSGPEKILAIPDLHNCPRHPYRTEVLTWLARHGSQRKFERVIQLGDWGSWDSVSRHDRADTFRGRTKPLISDDMAIHKESLLAWERGRTKSWKPKTYVTLGNHEQRLWDFENAHPECWGVHTDTLLQMWKSAGWMTRPYGELVYLGGVAFSHAPMGLMGKPISGKTAGPRTANELTTDLIHGHTHRFSATRVAKIGPRDSVLVIEAGCGLPWGEVEDYAKHSMTGWWWGAVELTVEGGQVTDFNAVSMKTLRSLYSDDGADVRRVA